MGIFFREILPQLRPAYFSGALAVILYVIGDFGVVALMRFPVFSYAVYTQYSAAFDRVYAAVLSLLLTAFSVILFALEARMRRRSISSPVGAAAKGRARVYALGAWRLPALLFVCALATISAALPAGTLLYWMTQIRRPEAVVEVLASFARSFAASVPAALIATAIAVPTVYLADRRPSGMSSALERTATLGYGIPPIALALGMVFFSLRGAPVLYQSLGVLIAAYSLNFLALALGPIRSALAQTPAQVEEAARSLGNTGFQAFALALVPALTKGMTSSAILVFIMSMKELPLTLLLSPTGYTTLASAVFSRTGEALYAEAAPFAAAIILFSSLCVGLVIRYEGTRHAPA
jgi:iron(III) transport system permease protein